ncbi:MAG: transporter substrate-binding domain-containing protein [Clostridium celatum]|nr:transporter substrate-binding domain-containing protein [Clostridium celatum]
MKKGLIKKVVASALLGIMTMGFVGCGASNKSEKESKDLLATIQEKGKVVVGMSADYAPYEFHYIDENGQDVIGGFDVDIANEIANSLGVELVIQEMDFDALVAALPAGKIDLVVSGMNPTEERAKVVDFSEIYYNSQHGILVRSEDVDKYKTFADLEGAKVGAQLGSTQEQIARSEVPNADLQLLNNVNNLILELKAGKVDAVIMEKPVAEMAVKSNPELAVGTPIYEDKTGGNAVGMAKNNPELLAKINEVIKELNETGKMDEYIVKANELAGSVNIVE